MYSVEVRVFPGKEFDDLDTGKEFLEKFGAFIGKNDSLLAETHQGAHEPSLHGHHDDEDGETSQSTGAQVDQEDDHTDDQLDWSGPTRVEKLGSKVNTRNVTGDVVDEFSIGVDVSSASGEGESLVVDGGDQSRT